MRAASYALLTAGLLLAPMLNAPLHAGTKHGSHGKAKGTAPAASAPVCEFPADRTAFDIEGLKSQLMVTALACQQQEKYNAFMARYQPTVAQQEHALNAYFKRAYGRAAQKAYDDYISNLANIQEQDGLKAGTAFCANLANMFSEVMSLHDSSELHDFVNSKTIAQPVTFETCTAAPPPEPVAHKRVVHGKRT
jgi:hypothetical protein